MDAEGSQIVKVPGVLRLNESIRDELLRKIYWKDEQYTRFGGGEYVRYEAPATRLAASLTNGLGLYEYTHGDGKFAKEIEKKFVPKNVRYGKYTVPPQDREKLKSWEGDYFEHFTLDTKLDEIGNLEFTKGRAINEFNRMSRILETKYITPNLINYYGSSSAMLPLTNRFAVLSSTGRLPDIPEANVTFIHDFWDKAYTDENFGQKKYLKALAEDAARVSNIASRVSHFLYGDGNYFSSYINFSQNNNGGLGVLSKQANRSSDGQEFSDKTGVFRPEKSRVKTDQSTRFYFDEGDVEHEGENERRLRVRETLKGEKNNLLHRTNKLFNEHKISTMVGRFHTSSEISKEPTEYDSAKTPEYGNSHGRNLLKRDHRGKYTNSYENPYCRVWTYHHQYDNNKKLIRPFRSGEEDTVVGLTELRESLPYGYDGINGYETLSRRTVLGRNGYVNIAPTSHGTETVDIKNCMFSLENLAWKDVAKKDKFLSREQTGPHGGRIMWFPPYDLDFQESVNVDWNTSKFLGRGEPMYTYSNTERNGTLSFALLIDHPSVIDNIPKNIGQNDTGNSASESGDLEADILRFFAGCEPLKFKYYEEEADPAKQKNIEPQKEKESPSDKDEVIKFYVFFPNNYSGHYNGGSNKINENNPDPDWFEYLAAGRDISVPNEADKSLWTGYEMKSGLGVTINKASTAYTQNSTDKIQCISSSTIGYGYRVDGDLRQLLVNKKHGKPRGVEDSNYNDLASFQLNNKKYQDATHSFYEVYSAMVKAFPDKFKKNYGDMANSAASALAEVLKVAKITKIIVKGAATLQDQKNSPKLARRRRLSVCNFLSNYGLTTTDENNQSLIDENEKNITVPEPNPEARTDDNCLEMKEQRFAVVEIHYNGPSISLVNMKMSREPLPGDLKQIQGKAEYKTQLNVKTNENGVKVIVEEPIPQTIPPVKESDNEKFATRTVSFTEGRKSRYETESEYFHKLKDGAPLIYRSIVDKFKYFDPAFHSISPEGFNARLTFLQQCTRQGHTIEATNVEDGYVRTAGNLAFGRMPVCVLRIGDFINTKVIVRSVSINYGSGGPMRFDLNQEGIGVQPLYAKISMQITILGGQSLEGPINRLQNAVTFNYYSNAEVYDNRADVRSPIKEGDGSYSVVSYDRLFIAGTDYEKSASKNPETAAKASESSSQSS